MLIGFGKFLSKQFQGLVHHDPGAAGRDPDNRGEIPIRKPLKPMKDNDFPVVLGQREDRLFKPGGLLPRGARGLLSVGHVADGRPAPQPPLLMERAMADRLKQPGSKRFCRFRGRILEEGEKYLLDDIFGRRGVPEVRAEESQEARRVALGQRSKPILPLPRNPEKGEEFPVRLLVVPGRS